MASDHQRWKTLRQLDEWLGGYITATLASYFVGRDAEKNDGPVAGSNELQQLAGQVRALRADLERHALGPPASGVRSLPQ